MHQAPRVGMKSWEMQSGNVLDCLLHLRKHLQGRQKAFNPILLVSCFLLRTSQPWYSLPFSGIGWEQPVGGMVSTSSNGFFRVLKIAPWVSYTSYSSTCHKSQQNTMLKMGALELCNHVNFNPSLLLINCVSFVGQVTNFHCASHFLICERRVMPPSIQECSRDV